MNGPRPTIDSGFPTEAKGRIPAFHSIEEEAVFWDTCDISDHLDDLERVEFAGGAVIGHALMIDPDSAEFRNRDRCASARGANAAALARARILERLRQESAAGAAASESVAGRARSAPSPGLPVRHTLLAGKPEHMI